MGSPETGNEQGPDLCLTTSGVTNMLALLGFSGAFLNSLIFPHAGCEEMGEVV